MSFEAESVALLERWAEVVEAVRAGGSVQIAVEQLDQIRARMDDVASRLAAASDSVRAKSRPRLERARRELAERIGRALLDMDIDVARALTARAHG